MCSRRVTRNFKICSFNICLFLVRFIFYSPGWVFNAYTGCPNFFVCLKFLELILGFNIWLKFPLSICLKCFLNPKAGSHIYVGNVVGTTNVGQHTTIESPFGNYLWNSIRKLPLKLNSEFPKCSTFSGNRKLLDNSFSTLPDLGNMWTGTNQRYRSKEFYYWH